MIFRAVGVKASTYMHGFKRGIFYADMYENGKEFLRGEIEEKDLKMKQKLERLRKLMSTSIKTITIQTKAWT